MTASPRLTTSILLIAVPVVFMAGFTGLQMTFGYPDILRHPAGEVLTRFAAGGVDLHLYWYAMMASALGIIPAAIGLGMLLWARDSFLAALSIAAGVLAGIVQALGLLRWVILIPTLAAQYVAPGATDLDHAAATSIFAFANQYLGVGVGEHFGYFFTAGWTLLVSALILREHRYIAITGFVIGLGVLFGLLEPFGMAVAGTVVAIAFTAWAVWTLLLGIVVLRGKRQALEAVAQPA
jgi:hypothetical protein